LNCTGTQNSAALGELEQNKIKFKSKLKMWYHTTDYTGGIKVTEDGSLGGGLGICERSFSIFIRWRKKQRKNKISSSSPSTPEEDWSEQIFGFFLSSTDGRVR
jgi:hypothetical protein